MGERSFLSPRADPLPRCGESRTIPHTVRRTRQGGAGRATRGSSGAFPGSAQPTPKNLQTRAVLRSLRSAQGRLKTEPAGEIQSEVEGPAGHDFRTFICIIAGLH